MSVVDAGYRRRIPALQTDPRAVGKAFTAYAANAHTFLTQFDLMIFWPALHCEFWPTNDVDREDIPYWYDLLYEDDVGVGQV